MSVEVKVPILAESVAEATLMQWHKKVGDTVQRGDSLIDIETDKVTLEVAAPNDGVLAEILKQDGEDVSSDEVIAIIETADRQPAAPEKQPQEKQSPEPAPQPETADVPPTEPVASPPEKPRQQDLPAFQAAEDVDSKVKMSPAVRNLVDQHGLDPEEIPAATPGRLTKEDVLQHIGEALPRTPEATPAPAPEPVQKPAPKPEVKQTAPQHVQPPEPAPQPEKAPAPAPAPVSAEAVKPQPAVSAPEKLREPAPVPPASPRETRPEKRVPMTRLRKRAAERLLNAQHENAILTTFNEINMYPVMELRKRYKDEFEKSHGVKLGFMSFFTKAAVEALKKFPVINASVEGEDIIYHGYFDIGIAVSSPRGLVVPIVRDADTLSLAGIEQTIRDLGTRANESKLTMEDLTGGTFTITNGGVFGSLLSTPIINPPQSAILGMHAMQERPVAENGNVVIRPMMYVALSYDHRIIDGREAVQFLVNIKELIEDPARLLLQV